MAIDNERDYLLTPGGRATKFRASASQGRCSGGFRFRSSDTERSAKHTNDLDSYQAPENGTTAIHGHYG